MKFLYQGDKNKKAAILIHPMFIDERCFEEFAKYLENDYYLMIPTLDGHYENSTFLSVDDEVRQIEEELKKNNIKQVEFVLGISLGAIIDLDYYAKNSKMVNHLYMDGAPIINLPRPLRAVFKNAFYKVACKVKADPEKSKMKLKDMFPNMEQIMIDVCSKVTSESCKNLSEACYNYKIPQINDQYKITIMFGTKESARMCRGKLKKKYSYAEFIDRKGYGHCGYFLKNVDKYAQMIKTELK